MGSAELLTAGAREAVAMRCTKGTLSGGAGAAAAAGAVRPRITRNMALSTVGPAPAAPRPLTETGPLSVVEPGAPRIVVAVNF